MSRLSRQDAKERGWLLDGYPRNFSQAQSLEEVQITPDIYIVLDVCDASSMSSLFNIFRFWFLIMIGNCLNDFTCYPFAYAGKLIYDLLTAITLTPFFFSFLTFSSFLPYKYLIVLWCWWYYSLVLTLARCISVEGNKRLWSVLHHSLVSITMI